jgi:ligand-binding sensor domain-containing protein/DNA-binding CsgD family transcriptional regulator
MRRILLFIFLPVQVFCQNTIGFPDIISYSKQVYGAGLQSWDIRQDKSGVMYFANNEGLLSFDGNNWNHYPLSNKTIVRSVEIGADNKVYVGGQDELGYFSPEANGQLQYHSLTRLLPEKDRSFGDVWDIVAHQKEIFFRAAGKIFRFSGEQAASYSAVSEWSYMGQCHGRLYAHDFKTGLLVFENDAWMPLPVANTLPQNDVVTAMLPVPGGSIIITTLKNGCYLLADGRLTKIASPNNSIFEKERIYAATMVSANWMALATSLGGVYITDLQGQIIQRFSKSEGLRNNNVLSIFLDRQSNLWLGLDNGIDFIAYNSAIKHISPYSQDGSGYTAIIHNNQLYVGTSSGLFSVALQQLSDLSFSKGDFLPVNNTTGQTWGISVINNQLLLGHHEGAFVIQNNTAIPLVPNPGFWNFVPLSDVYPAARLVAGNYKGLRFFDFGSQALPLPGAAVEGFSESSRFVAIDNNNTIWVSHPYRGVYKVTPQGNAYTTRLYTHKNGLPSALNNHIYKIKNAVIVAAEKGVYEYNAAKDIFEPSAFYQQILGNQGLRYLKEDKMGNTWFIREKQLGVIDMSGKEPAVIYLPELNGKMLSGFEFIYPVDANNIFLGGETGFYHINYEKYKKNMPELQVQVRSVRVAGKQDSLLFGGYFANVNEPQVQGENLLPQIASGWKTMRFEFSSAVFGYKANLEYSYRLKGFDERWSAWSSRGEKEYTNLPAGKYRFEVKVRNNFGNESAAAVYEFRILPPWYASRWVYLLYLLLACVLVYALYKWQRRKFYAQQARYEQEQQKLQYIHELELSKAESELVALRNEKLESEVQFKNSELASSAMHLVKKGELLLKMKGELTQVMKRVGDAQAISELKKMAKTLGEDDNIDKEWENFARHFDKVHSDFVVRLKERHPAITGNELKLCAYLRMNLSTKEIAQLMNISVRGVEISRYRLRKKLGIVSEVNLFDYLMALNKE